MSAPDLTPRAADAEPLDAWEIDYRRHSIARALAELRDTRAARRAALQAKPMDPAELTRALNAAETAELNVISAIERADLEGVLAHVFAAALVGREVKP